MKCGDKGHLTIHGHPCDQNIPEGAAGCLWHIRTPEERSVLARLGSIKASVSKRRALSSGTPRPELSSPEGCRTVLADTIQQVRTGQLHPQLGSVVIQGVKAVIELRAAEAQERMAEVLASVEHGGAALLMLSRLQDGLAEGKRRPLPGRVLASVPPSSEEPA